MTCPPHNGQKAVNISRPFRPPQGRGKQSLSTSRRVEQPAHAAFVAGGDGPFASFPQVLFVTRMGERRGVWHHEPEAFAFAVGMKPLAGSVRPRESIGGRLPRSCSGGLRAGLAEVRGPPSCTITRCRRDSQETVRPRGDRVIRSSATVSDVRRVRTPHGTPEGRPPSRSPCSRQTKASQNPGEKAVDRETNCSWPKHPRASSGFSHPRTLGCGKGGSAFASCGLSQLRLPRSHGF